MGQRNMHMIDLESDQQGQDFINPEPCVFYGGMTNFPHPNMHATVPAPGRPSNFDLHHLPDHHESPLFYGMGQYNQHPAASLDLNIASSSNHYTPYLAPPSAPRDFPVPVNHGTHDQLPFSSSHRMVGIPLDNYGRNNHYMEGARGSFKRKNAEGLPWNFQYCDAVAGSSSSVAPVNTRALESEPTIADAPPLVPPEYGGNDTPSLIDGGAHRSVRNRSTVIGPDAVLTTHNANPLIPGSYVSQPFHLPGNPWLGLQFSSNGGEANTVTWNQPSSLLPYMHGNMGLQGYQVTANRGSTGFIHTPIPQGHPSVHHPPLPIQGVRGHNMSFPSPVVTSSRRFSTNSASINSFQGIAETGPRYVGPVPPSGFRMYRPHRREVTPDMSARHRNAPQLRVLPEDGVAMLEVPGYHEGMDSPDQHRDMRLDIDHMSYEELLALGEQIGSVGTGLSEDAITNKLKTRSFNSFSCANLDKEVSMDEELDFCVICQTEYIEGERISTLECNHEYHADCIKKWLIVKNTCPICKSTALAAAGGGGGGKEP